MRHGLGKLGILLGVVAAHLEGIHDAMPVPRAAVVALRGDAHKVRAHEQERGHEVYLDDHRGDDGRLRFARLVHDVDAVDGRARAERERQEQNAGRGQEAPRVEVERMVRVQHDVRELDGIAHVLARDLDPQVVHEPRRVQVDVLALVGQGGHRHVGHAHRVLRGVEVRVVSVVGELDLHRELLGGLAVVEVEPDIVHLGVEVRELQRVVHGRELVLLVGRLLQVELVVQADGVVAGRCKVVQVEQERLQQERHGEDGEDALRQVPDRRPMRAHEARVGVGYVLADGGHTGNEL